MKAMQLVKDSKMRVQTVQLSAVARTVLDSAACRVVMNAVTQHTEVR